MACLVAAIGIVWLLVNWGYSRQIDALKQQVAAADQNIKLFKDRIPVLEKQLQDVQQSVLRHDSYDMIGQSAANVMSTVEALRRLQPDLLIPIRTDIRTE